MCIANFLKRSSLGHRGSPASLPAASSTGHQSLRQAISIHRSASLFPSIGIRIPGRRPQHEMRGVKEKGQQGFNWPEFPLKRMPLHSPVSLWRWTRSPAGRAGQCPTHNTGIAASRARAKNSRRGQKQSERRRRPKTVGEGRIQTDNRRKVASISWQKLR